MVVILPYREAHSVICVVLSVGGYDDSTAFVKRHAGTGAVV